MEEEIKEEIKEDTNEEEKEDEKKFKLSHPIMFEGKEITELPMIEKDSITGADVDKALNLLEATHPRLAHTINVYDTLEFGVNLYIQKTGIPIELLHSLHSKDYITIQNLTRYFLLT